MARNSAGSFNKDIANVEINADLNIMVVIKAMKDKGKTDSKIQCKLIRVI